MKRKSRMSSKVPSKRRRKNQPTSDQQIVAHRNNNNNNNSSTSTSLKTTSSNLVCKINELPDTILVQIFTFLTAQQRIRIERVCKRWSFISKCSWMKFRVINFGSFTQPDYPFATNIWPSLCWRRPVLNNHTLKTILIRCGKYLQCIDLKDYRDTLDYRILSVIGQFCPNLEIINLTGILVTNSSLRSLALRCRKLKSVIFQRCFQDSIIDRGLSYLLSNCPNLTSLNLSENERITGNCFYDLPIKLKYLVLSTCYELRDEGVRALADRCPNLEVLHLDSCDHVTAKALEYAFQKLTKLRVLHLGEYYATSQGVQMSTLCKLNQLRELYLNDNYLVNDDTLDSITRACANIEKLDISGGNKAITDTGLMHLCRLKHLTKLNLSYLCRISDVGLKMLAEQGRLDVLLLHRCGEITDDSVMILAKFCLNLTKLDLSCCIKITDISVWSFYHNAHKKRTRLSLCIGRTSVCLKEKDVSHPMLDLNFADYTFYWSQFRGGILD